MVRNTEGENIEMSHHRLYDNNPTRPSQSLHSDTSYNSLSGSTLSGAYNYYDVTHPFLDQSAFCDVKTELYDGTSRGARTQSRQYRSEDQSQADSPSEQLQLSALAGQTSWDQRGDLCGGKYAQGSTPLTDESAIYRPSWYSMSATAEMAMSASLSSAQRDWLQKREIVSSELLPYADLTSPSSFSRCNPFQPVGYGVFHTPSSIIHGDSRPSSWPNAVQVGYLSNSYQLPLVTSSSGAGLDFGMTSSSIGSSTDIRCQAAMSTSLIGRQDRGFLLAGGHVTEHAGQLPLSRTLKTEPRTADAGTGVAIEKSSNNQKDSKAAPAQRVTASTSTGKTRTKDKYRTVYSEPQKAELEKQYIQSTYISAQRKTDISRSICLSERQVKIWFQNRRAKDRKYKRRQPQRAQRSGIGGPCPAMGDHVRGGIRRIPSSSLDPNRCGAGVVNANVASTAASLLSSVRAFEQQHPGVVALSAMNVVNGGGYPRQLRL